MPKVLIVEDEKDIADILGEMLELFGYSIWVVSDGIEAWCQITAREYDLILTDLRLPGMDGIELLTKMRVHDIKTPVLIISGVELQGRVPAINKFAPFDLIQKPFKMEDLKEKLTRLLRDYKPQPQPKHKSI
jgi:two-component system, OmpR family, response regulator TctD